MAVNRHTKANTECKTRYAEYDLSAWFWHTPWREVDTFPVDKDYRASHANIYNCFYNWAKCV